jgi:hypothetical protein
MILILLVIALGILCLLSLGCTAICFEIDRKGVGILFLLLFVNWFRQFANSLTMLNGEPATNSWTFRLLASPEGALIIAVCIILSIVNALLEYQARGGTLAIEEFDDSRQSARARALVTTRPGSGVVETVVVAPITSEAGVREVKAISEGELPPPIGSTTIKKEGDESDENNVE